MNTNHSSVRSGNGQMPNTKCTMQNAHCTTENAACTDATSKIHQCNKYAKCTMQNEKKHNASSYNAKSKRTMQNPKCKTENARCKKHLQRQAMKKKQDKTQLMRTARCKMDDCARLHIIPTLTPMYSNITLKTENKKKKRKKKKTE